MDISRLRPTPSMAVAITALVLAASGVTWAATSLPRDSVGSAQVRDNSVRSGDIRNGNVRAADIGTSAVGPSEVAQNAVGSAEIANNSITGDDLLESTLGQVPSAATAGAAVNATNAANAENANNANSLGGAPASSYIRNTTVVPFHVEMDFGDAEVIARSGPVSLVAQCRANFAGVQDELRLLGESAVDGAFMQGDTPHSGPGVGSTFLTPNTPQDNRVMGGIVSTVAGDGQPAAEDDIDTGFVAGPNGEYIGIDETTMYALNVGGSDCLIAGIATVLE